MPVTLIGLDAARKCSMENDIDVVYHSVLTEIANLKEGFIRKPKVIITLCNTGEGGAEQLKEYIDKYSNFVEKSMQRLSNKVAMPALDNLNSNLSFSGGTQRLAFSGDVSSKFTVEVPVILDSTEVARVIAKPMSKELQNQQDKKN